jgi:uncharacterized protein YndB with AHSA1/START domain
MPADKTIVQAEPGKQDLLIIREFNAPRGLVFRAFTDPELYVQWLLGPKKQALTITLDKFEPRAGGSWRYRHRDEAGNVFAFHGSYHEVQAPELIIDTFEFEGMPEKGHVSLETARFQGLPGDRTRLTLHSVFQSVADRDGMLQSGMEEGLNDSFERLEELVSKRRT